MEKYWFDNLTGAQSWTSLWSQYTICENCGGIRKTQGKCSVCHKEISFQRFIKVKDSRGKEIELLSKTSMGAEGRYEDYIYLNMLEYEWKRPESNQFEFFSKNKRPAAKAIIVLIFWTYFETRIERLLDCAMKDLSNSIRTDFFKRYQSISSRTCDLYKILFGKSNSYFIDLEKCGLPKN